MGSSRYSRWRAGCLGAAVWITMALSPVAADEPKATATTTDEAKPTAGATGTRQTPTLAPPRQNAPKEKESASTSDSQGASAQPRASEAETKPVTSAVPTTVPGRLPEKANDAKSSGAGGKTVLQLLPDDRPAETPAPKKPESSANSDDKLRPIPEESASGKIEVETASFNGVTPGVSTAEDVKKHWGVPKEMNKHNGAVVHLYSVDPFDRVEVIFYENKVASIIIRLSHDFPADGVARQLVLSKLEPVLVSNDMGEILGQSYPERGVLFSFTPSPTPGTPGGLPSRRVVLLHTGGAFGTFPFAGSLAR